VRGLEGRVDRAHQIALHGVQVDGMPQPRGKGGDDRLGVVPGPVEPAVDRTTRPYARNVP
jgi:hypothetical protein